MLEQLRALDCNVGRAGQTEETLQAVSDLKQVNERQTDQYMSLVDEIERKEKLLQEKEREFIEEAREVVLSSERQQQVDKRKQELEEVLKGMMALESQFDEIDKEFDEMSSFLIKDLELPASIADIVAKAPAAGGAAKGEHAEESKE